MLRSIATSIVFGTCILLMGVVASPGWAQVKAQKVAEGFFVPWSLAFLPDGAILVTDREVELWRVDRDGSKTPISGLPKIVADGQGGLLDILVPQNFARTREVFLSYSIKQGRGSGTAMARARLSPDGKSLEDVTQIFQMTPGSKGGRHFGGRIVEARDGSLFLTIGERGDRPSAQDLVRHNGSVVRIHRDGSVPTDNPFVDQQGVAPEIWTLGHRNPQGAALDKAGQLWVTEHGARGGDEVNRVRKGKNYGWPIIAYGRHYTGFKIGEGTAKPGLEQPEMYWDPSIAPSGLTFYQGDLFPDWRGDAFVGSLKFDYIARLSGAPLQEVEQIKLPESLRVRDVRTGPDGAIWFLSEGQGALYRLIPD
ncbi:MAG: PQQ-dependent sugar dehydrogenase [Thalassovita sp.]